MLKTSVFVLIVFVSAILITLIIRKLLRLFINRYAQKIKVDPTNYQFLLNAIPFIVFTGALIVIFTQIPSLKNIGKAIFASAGIFAAIVGFASQKAFSNIIGGVFILVFKPFRVDDIIETTSSGKGVVEDITLRHTVIRDYENRRIIIPNSAISDYNITNSTIRDERIRKRIEVDVAYSTNLNLAIDTFKQVIEEHPLCIDVRSQNEILSGEEKVQVIVLSLDNWSVKLRGYCWAEGNDKAFELQCDVLKSTKLKFDEVGVEIPYPYQNVIIKNESNTLNA